MLLYQTGVMGLGLMPLLLTRMEPISSSEVRNISDKE